MRPPPAAVHEVIIGRRTGFHFSFVQHRYLLSEVPRFSIVNEVGSHELFRY